MTSKRSKIFAKQILNSQQADVGSLRLNNFVTTPTPTHQNLNTIVGLDTKITVHPTPPLQKLNRGLLGPQINIYWPQLNIMWLITSNRGTTTTFTTITTTKWTAFGILKITFLAWANPSDLLNQKIRSNSGITYICDHDHDHAWCQ